MGQKSRWTLPDVVHPLTYRKFVICVPNERFYIAAFQGLLIELTYSKNWQRDLAHTAAAVSRVWQDALESVLCDDCGETILMEESDYEMSICEQLRFQNGKLQGFCCGEWVDIEGQSGNPPGGGDQPGDGTEQPPEGGCASYHAKMAASNQWYLPTVVSSGDTIEVTNPDGAGNDGTLSPWHCPSGDTFFAGACIGGTGGPSGGDPDSAANHMELVVNIDGTWYEPLAGIITVPGGVSNASVYFQVNDATIGDNAGSYTFDVEVCNNQPASWSHFLNFLTGAHGVSWNGATSFWTPSVGLGATAIGPNIPLRWRIPLPTNTELTAVEITYANSDESGGPPEEIVRALDAGLSVLATYDLANVLHSNVSETIFLPGAIAGVRYLEINTNTQDTGTINVSGLKVFGSGPEPVWP